MSLNDFVYYFSIGYYLIDLERCFFILMTCLKNIMQNKNLSSWYFLEIDSLVYIANSTKISRKEETCQKDICLKKPFWGRTMIFFATIDKKTRQNLAVDAFDFCFIQATIENKSRCNIGKSSEFGWYLSNL